MSDGPEDERELDAQQLAAQEVVEDDDAPTESTVWPERRAFPGESFTATWRRWLREERRRWQEFEND